MIVGFCTPDVFVSKSTQLGRIDRLEQRRIVRRPPRSISLAYNCKKQLISPMASTAAALLPKISLQDDQIVLSHLRIGHTRAPRVPRGIFHTVIIEAGVSKPEADEAFDHILHVNRMRFLELLASTEMHEGPMIVTLRKMAQFQLEAISHCIGTRHFDEPADVQAAAWQASIRH